MLTHLSLFTGIGGIDLAAEWAGFETVGQCEWADYPTKVLEKHWPDVPRWRDIRELTYDKFIERTGLRTVNLVSGGFPCQPFSVAGNQKGKEDDRYLWPEMLRVIREFAPDWVLGENVPGILRIAADEVCQDLEREGYEVGIFNFEAAAVGAMHRRDRVFFVARNANREHEGEIEKVQDGKGTESCGICADVADTDYQWELQPQGSLCEFGGWPSNGSKYVSNSKSGRVEGEFASRDKTQRFSGGSWWAAEPNMGGTLDGFSAWLDRNQELTNECRENAKAILSPWDGDWERGIPRVANGIPSRVDRLKCLGNAVVPQQVYPILKAIAELYTIS